MAVTENIFSIVMDYAKKENASKVKKISLKIGKMTGIVGECIEFYYETLSKDTIAEGAEIAIDYIPVRAKCESCKKEFEAEDMIPLCPHCSSMICSLISGKELELQSIEVEKEGPEDK